MTSKKILGNYRPHDRVQPPVNPQGLTKQSFKEECDINHIMKQFEKTGLITHKNAIGGQYGDFILATDYHTGLNRIMEAQEMFLTMPSKIRAQFDNDPEKFLAFAQNPENKSELIELGLADSPETLIAAEQRTKETAGEGEASEPAKAPSEPSSAS